MCSNNEESVASVALNNHVDLKNEPINQSSGNTQPQCGIIAPSGLSCADGEQCLDPQIPP